MSRDSRGGGSFVTSPLEDVRATSLLHALSEIEQFSAAEIEADLPEGVIPMLPRFSFIDVGLKSAFITTLVTFILAPLTMLVTHYILPVFGESEPKLIDKIFVYSFSSGPAVAMTLLIGLTTMKAYRGSVTKSLINNLLLAYGLVKIFTSIVLMAIGYLIYSKYNAYAMLKSLFPVIKFIYEMNQALGEIIYDSILSGGKIIKSSVKFAAFLHVGTAVFLLIAHKIGVQRTKKIELLRKEWE